MRSRPPWRAAQRTPERGAAEGAFLLWLLLLGKQKKVTCRRASPGHPTIHSSSSLEYHPHVFQGDFLIIPTRSPQDAGGIQAIDHLLHFPGRLLALHNLQNLMLQEHAVQADFGEYVLEFDSGGEYVQGGIVDCVDGG